MIRSIKSFIKHFKGSDFRVPKGERKQYEKMQKGARKKLKKLAKEFRPWSGYYMHEVVVAMLEFYEKTYSSGYCCFSESAKTGKTAESLKEALEAANNLEYIDELNHEELIVAAQKDGVAFTNYLNKWKAQFDNPILDGPNGDKLLSGVAYDYLEKKYTKKMYNIIGTHIWEWRD